MFSRPTRGLSMPSMSCGVHAPQLGELHQLVGLAVHVGAHVHGQARARWLVGMRAPTGGRSTPGIVRRVTSDAAITAPVLPALMKASTSPALSRFTPTTMDESRLRRIAVAGASPISITSLACADLQPVAGRVGKTRQLGLDPLRVADQDDANVVVPVKQSSDRPLDLDGRGTVGAHRVQRDPHLFPVLCAGWA